MSQKQTATVCVLGYEFTVNFMPGFNEPPIITELWLGGDYPDNVLPLIDQDVLLIIRKATALVFAENEEYASRAKNQEQSLDEINAEELASFDRAEAGAINRGNT